MADTVVETLGPGQDTVTVPNYFMMISQLHTAPSTVYDISGFTPGDSGDVLSMQGTVIGNSARWPFSSGMSYVDQRGANAVVVWTDPVSANSYDVVTLRGVDARLLTAHNFAATGGPAPPINYEPTVQLSGTATSDAIAGGALRETISGLDGNDTLDGGGGADDLRGDGGADLLHGGDGNDMVRGLDGDDTVYGDAGDDGHVNGNRGADMVFGGAGNDTLYGGQGDDTIHGDSGDDLISGDLGNDHMFGDAGADSFAFRRGSGSDFVDDFNGGEGDRIVLPTGTSYALATANGQVVIDLGNGDSLTLASVSPASFNSAWITFA